MRFEPSLHVCISTHTISQVEVTSSPSIAPMFKNDFSKSIRAEELASDSDPFHDLEKLSRNVMKRIWDNSEDDHWDNY